jgi:hypothetical protein
MRWDNVKKREIAGRLIMGAWETFFFSDSFYNFVLEFEF